MLHQIFHVVFLAVFLASLAGVFLTALARLLFPGDEGWNRRPLKLAIWLAVLSVIGFAVDWVLHGR